MLRLAVFIILTGTVVGALMPPDREQSRANEAEAAGLPTAVAPVSAAAATPTATAAATSVPPSFSPVAAPEPTGWTEELQLARAADGHFYADAQVNGASIQFMIDTGASGVALTQEDAARAGISFSPSQFMVVGHGASGEVRGQPVLLSLVKLGSIEGDNLPAVVLEGSRQSLLGQSVLRQFDSVTIAGDTMVLR